jgi:protein JSN1
MNHNLTNPSPPLISFKQARSRLGTLSSINNNSPSLLPTLNQELLGIGGDALGLPSMDTLPVDIPRMRSGSLFSTNSIWNDDISCHSQDDTGDKTLRQRSYTNNDDFDRNRQRSYTTNHLDFTERLKFDERLKIDETLKIDDPLFDDSCDNHLRNRSYTIFDNKYQYKRNDINLLLDNLMEIEGKQDSNGIIIPINNLDSFDGSRLRSQTLIPVNNLPILIDNFDFTKLSITTNFENSNLSPQKIVLIDNLPVFIDCMKLFDLLNSTINQKLGTIVSIKLSNNLNNSKIAICETSSIDLAMMIKNNFNHYELLPNQILFVAFAKIDSKDSNASNNPPKPIINEFTDLVSIKSDLLSKIKKLSNKVDFNKILSIINNSINYSNDLYQNNFGPLPDPISQRKFDSSKLRELRKILDNENEDNGNEESGVNPTTNTPSPTLDYPPTLSQIDLECLCLSMLDEAPELCYDYLGNTIIQKLFTLVESKLIKLMLVKEIAPYITQLSIHKNGTWAIQKIISLCEFDLQQKYLIGASLKPYSVKLFNDQFGNYVLQGCIKFGSPFNDFIFETMLDNFLEISVGRFGARCIRTILETADNGNNKTPYITQEQILLVAGLIVEFSNELVTNSNGSLLITWYLDTFNSSEVGDKRYELITDKLLPNLKHLCIHKLSNLTILKILNNRSDLKTKQIILDKIFGKFDDEDTENKDSVNSSNQASLLEFILAENQDNTTAGPLFINKIISNPALIRLNDNDDPIKNNKYHEFIVSKIKRIILESNINNYQPYKKLMEEVGLPTSKLNRSGSMGARRSNKRNNGHHNNHGHNHNHNHNHNGMKNNQFNNNINSTTTNINNTNNNNGMISNSYNLQNQYQQYSLSQQAMMNPMVGAPPQFMYNQQLHQPIQLQPQMHLFPMAAIMNQPQSGRIQANGHISANGHIQPNGHIQANGHNPPNGHLPPQNGQVHPQVYQYQPEQLPIQNQQDIAVMQQLEQLSLSSAALGYSNPGTPTVASSQKNQFL